MYYFVRITPANFVYAFWLSLRAPVGAWKVEVPDALARRFRRVKPYRVFSRDEWLLAHDKAFDLWKARAWPSLARRHTHAVELGGRSVDFSRNLGQLLGMEFEALSLFVSMLEKGHPRERGTPLIVEPRIASAFGLQELQAMLPGVRIMPSLANRSLETLHEWLVAAAHLGRQVALFALGIVRRAKSPAPRAVAWLGVSPQEIPDRGDRLDFSWAARCGLVPAGEVLYFLAQNLNPAQRAYLDSQQIEYVEPAAAFNVLPMAARFRVAARSIGGVVAALARPAAVAPLLARLMARAPHWDALFTHLRTTTYVTTTSYSWPEKPELAVAAARGIRTVIWAYSANSLTFTVHDPAFRDLGIVRSIVIADEFWVWNLAYAKWLEKRRVEAPGRPCEIRVTGPLMCGNPALLNLAPPAARERLGLPRSGLCIGVFDMPPLSDLWRDRFGGGPPMVDTETYIEFWKVIERVLEQVPGCYALVKLKRDFSHPWREFPDALRAFLDEQGEPVRSGRVHSVDVNVDPYLPVAACDIAVGIAYTSPVLAARTAGKPGYYLDPLRRASFPSDPDFKLITLHTEEQVVSAVLRARDDPGAALVSAPAITPPAPELPWGRKP